MWSAFCFLTLLGLSQGGPNLSNPPKTIDGILQEANIDQTIKKGPTEFPDGSVLVELDMRLNRDQYEAIHGNKKESSYKGLRDEKYRWTNNIMPYEIKEYFSKEEVAVIRGAMDEWEKYTCLKLIPHTTEENYIEIISGSGCWSMVGMNGRKQQLSLQRGSCTYHHTAVHELGHAVGFHHEQTRPDRDDYVTIMTENIQSWQLFNFDKYDTDLINDQGVTYDYWSVMHYSQYAFSSNGKPTIKTKDPDYDVVIGSVPGLSFKDIQAANLMYKCSDHCTNECPKKAIRSKDCKCWCNTGNPRLPVVEWDGVTECKGGDDIKESCIDYYDECPRWAKEGECDANAYWMSQNCMKSCDVCGPDPACRDFNQEWCPYWAMIGECQRNPGWMMINCRFSCKVCGEHPDFGECEDRWPMCEQAARDGICETNSESMLTECPVSCKACGPGVECKNWDARCYLWKEEGRCTKETKFMERQCGQECGFCTNGTLPDCRDYANSRDCVWWAANGECSYNPGWMNRKCPLSCKLCGEDALCMDHDVYCHEYGFDGKCDTDKEYMHFACRAECKLCEGDPDDKPGCKNYDHNCDHWIAEGECDKNPGGMLYYCPRGCKACGPGTLCKDWHPECPTWKADGECKANPTYMNRHCPLSCDTCCDDPKGCDIIGGPGPGLCNDYPNCYDYLDDCEEKAAAGECFSDPDDMLRLCPRSCKLCGNESECHDYKKDDCARWAFIGECVNNPSYMETYCRKSCRCCEKREGPGRNCTVKIDCRDFRDNCKERAAAGECYTDPNMLSLCPISCKLCGDDQECKNFDDKCHHWASIGECEKNPTFMERHCRKACQCCVSRRNSEPEIRTKVEPIMECMDVEPCYDFLDNCTARANAGECFADPGEMLRLCPIACQLCGDNAECNDYNENCDYWASYGECENNPTYMQTYCRKACDCCAAAKSPRWV